MSPKWQLKFEYKTEKMKKLFLLPIVMISLAATAQENVKAPAAAKNAFAKSFTGAKKVKWEKEDGNYEVTFEQNGKEMSAIYNPKGLLQETEYAIKISELPASVTSYLKSHYKGVAVKDAAKITKADGTVLYEAGIKGKDVLFDVNGKFVKEAKD